MLQREMSLPTWCFHRNSRPVTFHRRRGCLFALLQKQPPSRSLGFPRTLMWSAPSVEAHRTQQRDCTVIHKCAASKAPFWWSVKLLRWQKRAETRLQQKFTIDSSSKVASAKMNSAKSIRCIFYQHLLLCMLQHVYALLLTQKKRKKQNAW